MSKMKDTLKEVRTLKPEALQARLKELQGKMRELTFKTRGDEIKDVHTLRKVRKEVAQILTVLAEKGTINPPSSTVAAKQRPTADQKS